VLVDHSGRDAEQRAAPARFIVAHSSHDTDKLELHPVI